MKFIRKCKIIMASCPEVSERVLQQRMRNHIIDYLELAASAEMQLKYEEDVLIAWVPAEMLNGWTDHVGWPDFQTYMENLSDVFSEDERAAIRNFQCVWEFTLEAFPDPLPSFIHSMIITPAWERFMKEAENSLRVFERRGRFSNEIEEPYSR